MTDQPTIAAHRGEPVTPADVQQARDERNDAAQDASSHIDALRIARQDRRTPGGAPLTPNQNRS